MRVTRLLLVAVVLVSGCTWSKIRTSTLFRRPQTHALILGRVELAKEGFRAPWKATGGRTSAPSRRGFVTGWRGTGATGPSLPSTSCGFPPPFLPTG
jgi:hypothetical protein